LDDLAQRDAHRHLDQPGIANVAGEREDLGAFALLGADSGEPPGPVATDRRDIGERLDVVDQRWAAPQPALGRAGRPPARHAAPAPDRGHQRSPLAAHECARADADVDAEVERRLEDLAAEQAEFLGLLYSALQAPDRERILATNVDIALARAHRVRGDRHP